MSCSNFQNLVNKKCKTCTFIDVFEFSESETSEEDLDYISQDDNHYLSINVKIPKKDLIELTKEDGAPKRKKLKK